VKYEDIYLHDYRTMQEACEGDLPPENWAS